MIIYDKERNQIVIPNGIGNINLFNNGVEIGYKQGKIDGINIQKAKLESINITENGTYSIDDQETVRSIAFDGYSYFNTGIFPTENIKIEACIKITNGNDSSLGGIIIGGGIGKLGKSTENRGIAIGMNGGGIYGVWGAIKSRNKPYKIEGEGTTTVVLQKTDDSWVWDGEKGSFGASGLYIGGYNSNDIAVEKRFLQSIVYIKIWTDRNDDSTLITYTPKTNGNFDANGVELQRLGDGTTTYVKENVIKYPYGFKRVEVNVPDLNGSYDEGYEQGKIDGVNEQKSKLESISITENGTYRKEDGYNEIVVDVPDLNGSYDEGYEQGQADIAANARVLNVTENGQYGDGETLYKTINVDVKPKINVKKAGLKFGESKFTEVPEWADFEGITDMSSMFRNCQNLQTIPQIDTSSVTDASSMFYTCNNLKTLPNNFNFGICTNFGSMFNYTPSLTDYSFLETWVFNPNASMDNMINNTNTTYVPAIPCVGNTSYYQSAIFWSNGEFSKLTYFGGWIGRKYNVNKDNMLKKMPNLTYESCISILNNLYDFTGNGETPNSSQGKLKVAQSFIDKVGDEISIGVAKGWVISA